MLPFVDPSPVPTVTAANVTAVFEGLKNLWLLVGPVVGGLLGAWLTSRNQSHSDRERAEREQAQEKNRWTRDATERAVTRGLAAVTELHRTLSFLLWWRKLQLQKSRVMPEWVKTASDEFNQSEKELLIATQLLRLLDDSIGEALFEYHSGVKVISRHLSTATDTYQKAEQVEQAKLDLDLMRQTIDHVMVTRARELLGLAE